VEPDAHGITVAYVVGTAEKTTTLDVSRKAEITLNGEQAGLESLGSGQKATIEYHKDLAIVTKIDATGESLAAPELVEVSELERPFAPCLSEDGLTIYFERFGQGQKPTIYTAHRRDVDSFFEDEKMLFEGRQPTVTNDGLEMILVGLTLDTPCFHSATRDNVEQSFRRPKPIPELRDPPGVAWSRDGCISPDGLAFYFCRGGKIVVSRRPDRTSAWSDPKILPMTGTNLFPKYPSCPFITDDGLTLFCVVTGAPADWMLAKGNLLEFTRISPEQPFANPEFVEIEGFPKLVGRYPRYMSATKELLFLQSEDGNLGKNHVILIKNFVP
jgi:hypothetical protein